jgi:hypothetical protein
MHTITLKLHTSNLHQQTAMVRMLPILPSETFPDTPGTPHNGHRQKTPSLILTFPKISGLMGKASPQ